MPSNVIRSAKEVKLQDMLDHYNEISQIGVMDFSDYYDSRMDGVNERDLQQSPELNDYVEQLLTFQREADSGELEEEEKDLFQSLKIMLLAETEETGIHKLLQFKLMDGLLRSDGDLDSENLKKAADCQELYDAITSYDIIENNAKKQAMQDDGSFNKSPKKIAEEILEKENKQEKKPLQEICYGMLEDVDTYSNILHSPALTPYHTLLQEKLKVLEQAEEEQDMTPQQQEKQQLTREIEKKQAELEKLQQNLDKTSEAFRKEYTKAREDGIILSIPSKKRRGARVMKASAIQKMQQHEKVALDKTFHETVDDLVRHADALKATDHGPVSDKFRKMVEGLTMLRNQKDTLRNIADSKNSRHLSLVDALSGVYNDTRKYLEKRDKDSFFSRHFGKGGTRYKQAKEVLHLLETYHNAAEQLELHRTKDVLLQRQIRKEELQQQIHKTEKEIQKLTVKRDGEPQREDLSRRDNAVQKSKGTRQRLKNGYKDLNNTSRSKEKHIDNSKKRNQKTSGKGKSVSVKQQPKSMHT